MLFGSRLGTLCFFRVNMTSLKVTANAWSGDAMENCLLYCTVKIEKNRMCCWQL